MAEFNGKDRATPTDASNSDSEHREYEVLFRSRTSLRSKFTRLYNQSVVAKTAQQIDVSRLKWYVEELEKTMIKLDEIDVKLEDILLRVGNEDDVTRFTNERDNRSENDSYCLFDLKEFVRTIASNNESVVRGLSELSENLGRMVLQKSEGVKLPKLTLPTFDGNPLNWMEFWDIYKATIHENTQVSDAQKLAYLRGQLEGKALEAVEGFKQVEANYKAVVETLEKRFGKPRLIAKEHIKKVLESEAMNKIDVSVLRKLWDNWAAHVRSLKEMELDPTSSPIVNLTFLTIFEKKVPTEMLRRWELKCHSKEESQINIAAFFDFLSMEVEASEAKIQADGVLRNEEPFNRNGTHNIGRSSLSGNRDQRTDYRRDQHNDQRNDYRRDQRNDYRRDDRNRQRRDERNDQRRYQQQRTDRPSTAAASCSARARPVGQNEVDCAVCSKIHDVDTCCDEIITKSSDDLLKKVYDNRLCRRCMSRQYHIVRNCNMKNKCLVCRRTDHHTVLHDAVQRQYSNRRQGATGTTTNSAGHSCKATVYQPEVKRLKNDILLQSARARLKLPDGRQVDVRILIDSGSNRSFVTEAVVDSFGLHGEPENVSVKLFGGGEIKTSRRRCVELELMPYYDDLPSQSVMINAVALPKICEGLDEVMTEPMQFRHLRKLRLADDYPRQRKEVDILIGMDYYHDVMKARTVRGKRDQPVAAYSVFGWILSGPISCNDKMKIDAYHLQAVSNEQLNDSLKQFWKVESLGIVDDDNKRQYSQDEEEAIKQFTNTIRFEDGRYIATLPKSNKFPPEKTNYHLSMKRFHQMEKRYARKSDDDKRVYQEAIEQYKNDGMAEEVIEENPEAIVRYLPHQAVIKKKKVPTATLR